MADLPVTQTLTIYQGATFRARFRWLTDAGPQNLEGWTGRMQVRPRPGGEIILELNTENGGIALGTDGYVNLYASPFLTGAMLRRIPLLYELELIEPDGGDIVKFLRGEVVLVPEITA